MRKEYYEQVSRETRRLQLGLAVAAFTVIECRFMLECSQIPFEETASLERLRALVLANLNDGRIDPDAFEFSLQR